MLLSRCNQSVSFSLNWLDEFADPQLAKTLYGCPFPLIDVTVMPDDDIVQHRRVALLELMQNIFASAISAT